MTTPIGLFSAAYKYCTGSQEGLNRVLKFLSANYKWMNAVSGKDFSSLKEANNTISHGRTILKFTSLPGLIGEAYGSIHEFVIEKHRGRLDCEELVENVADATSLTYGVAKVVFSSFFETSPWGKFIGKASEVVSSIGDVASFGIPLEKGLQTHNATPATTEEAQKQKEDRITYLLKSISKAAAAAAAIFTLINFAMGITLISTVTSLSLSLIAATVGLGAKIWETSLDRKPRDWAPLQSV